MAPVVQKIINTLKMRKRLSLSLAAALLVLILAAIFGQSYFKKALEDFSFGQKRDWRYELPGAGQAYSAAEAIVSPTVSKSANIVINLPPEIKKAEALPKVSFVPAIAGEWLDDLSEEKIVYQPREKLKVGNYYTVTIAVADGAVGGDFLVEDDPAILNVFPKADTETDESSDITIMFNRPMVPLSTLEVMAPAGLPVEITPATTGRFKWVGTRTLQFIPETALVRSSNYRVRIKPEFASLDGLKISVFEHKFKTRVLRYEYVTSGQTVYNQPIMIVFNQPVDLERTRGQIALKNATDNAIEALLEYGRKKTFNAETKKYEESEDRSKILVYQAKDRYGRKKFWDFNTDYSLVIKSAVPAEGDIILNEQRSVSIQVKDVVKSTGAESERSNFAAPDFFDPAGKLIVEFYEDIDLERSEITADKLLSKVYGLKCRADENGQVPPADVECEKETDRAKIILTFNNELIKKGDRLVLRLNKVINSENKQINREPIALDIRIIPELKILSSVPRNNAVGADLTDLYLCTNAPLTAPSPQDAASVFSFNLPYEFKAWHQSFRVPATGSTYYKCAANEFQTFIYYGLMPESAYSLNLKLEDHFGGRSGLDIAFRTKKIPDYFLNFYHYQEKVLTTVPAKTKLTFAGENMEYVNLHICRLTAEDMMKLILDGPQYYEGPAVITGCLDQTSARIELGKKYWVKNIFQLDLKDYIKERTGHYLLTFSHPNYREYWDNKRPVYERVYVTITNLGLTEKKIDIGEIENQSLDAELKNIYWVTDLSTLAAVADATVDAYGRMDDENIEKRGSTYTDGWGIALLTATGTTNALIVKKGNDSAILANTDHNLETAGAARSARRIYTYTDRPIYRPGDEVHAKGIYRIGYDNDYEVFPDKKVEVRVTDSRQTEILKKEVAINEYGTFAFGLTLPADAALGTYFIETDNSSSYFDVEEYVPAAFKLELAGRQEEYVSGDTMELDINASYYFGAPVENASLAYSIASQDYYFDRYQSDGFSFGTDWYFCYWGCSYNDKFVLRNTAKLDQDGRGRIAHKLDFKELYKKNADRKSKIFVVYLTVQNENGQSVSGQQSFIVHGGDHYLGLKTDKRFLGRGESFSAALKSVNTEGVPISVAGIDLTLNRVEWLSVKRREVDGGYYYKWEEKLTPVETGSVGTDAQGNFTKKYAIKDEGEYRLLASSKDARGNTVETAYDLYVYGEGQADIRPTNDHSLELITDKKELKVGDTGEVIIKSPFAKAKALIALERGRVFSYDVVPIDQSLYNYRFRVTADHIPNIFASVTLLSPGPDIKYGSTQFMVNTRERGINIEVTADKKSYLPGEEVRLAIKAADSSGQPVEADISVAVVDLSVLALKGNPKKNPLIFFYGGFPLAVTTASNIKNILNEIDVPSGTKGGGGAEPDDLSAKKRGIFKDTAYWESFVRTGSNGQAELKFILPDNLTTWQVETLGVTKDTKLGINYRDFTAKKDLMITPLAPRFVVPGDEFAVGAKIFNQSDDAQELTVACLETGLVLLDQSPVTVRLLPKTNDTVYFRVKAPAHIDRGSHSFTLRAANGKLEDTVVKTVKIRRNDTYETTATAGYSKKAQVNEYVYLPDNILPDKGGLTVNVSATLAVFLADGLNSLLDYSYGCSEQIASKLDAIAIIKRGLNLENVGDKFNLREIEYNGRVYTIDELVEIGLTDIYKTQTGDGGFAYYPGAFEASFYLSLHLANTFGHLQAAGYKLDEDRMKRLYLYIQNTILNGYSRYNFSYEDYIYAAAALGSIKDYGAIRPRLTTKIGEMIRDEQYLNEKIGSLGLANLILFTNEEVDKFGLGTVNYLYNKLENRIEIDSRGAFLPQGEHWSWYNYETPVKNTAVMLKALARGRRDNNLLDGVLRWLMRSRYKDGAWGSTQNTLSTIDALVDYLIWQKENEADFRLAVSLNQNDLKNFEFNPANLFEQGQIGLSLPEIEGGKLNRISFVKTDRNEPANNFYYDLALKYYLPANAIPPRDEGLAIERGYYAVDDKKFARPLAEATVGEVLKGHLKITVPKQRHFVSVEDFIPAGAEIVNFNLATENISVTGETAMPGENDYYGDGGYGWYENWRKNRTLYPDFIESHDDRLFLFKEDLAPGIYEYDYYVRALVPGSFQWLPAQVSEMYFPENFGRTGGSFFVVNEKK